MKKRLLCLVMSLILLGSLIVPAYAAESLNNFKLQRTYPSGLYTDVQPGSWYVSSVQKAYELGLVNGDSPTTFNPNGNITLAESLALACRLYDFYYGGNGVFVQGEPWYGVYVDFAIEKGIIAADQYSNYDETATRAQFAAIMDKALPDEALPQINDIDSIPDVPSIRTYAPAVYKLYRAGILTGNDQIGTFSPDSSITRSEVAAIIVRMALVDERKSFSLKAASLELSAEQIYEKCAPAVFYIEVYNAAGTALGSGSGFFLNSSGTAVTNYHVIDGAASAKITVSDTGKVYNVSGVYDYDKNEDWAILKIDGSGFTYLDIGETSSVIGGANVFAIGSPLGLQNTISQGIISNPSRVEEGIEYIQISAAISHGSSGGALINKFGKVIGITSASYTEGQNLNLALPITYISGYSTSALTALSSLAGTPSGTTPVSPSSSVYDYLAGVAIRYGSASSSGTYIYIFKTDYQYPYDHAYSLIYDPGREEVSITMMTASVTSNLSTFSQLTLTPSLSSPYDAALIYDEGYGSEIFGAMNIYPAIFTDDTSGAYLYTCTSSNYGVKNQLAVVLHLGVWLSLVQLDSNVLAGSPYSLADLGFVSIYY